MPETHPRGSKGPLFRPMPGWLTVRPRQQKEVTESGLFVPKNIQRRQIVGTVVAKGDPLRDANGLVFDIDIQPGDTITFSRHSGQGWENQSNSDVELIFLKFVDIISRIATEEELDKEGVDAFAAPTLKMAVL
jgi:chaperonin GroES